MESLQGIPIAKRYQQDAVQTRQMEVTQGRDPTRAEKCWPRLALHHLTGKARHRTSMRSYDFEYYLEIQYIPHIQSEIVGPYSSKSEINVRYEKKTMHHNNLVVAMSWHVFFCAQRRNEQTSANVKTLLPYCFVFFLRVAVTKKNNSKYHMPREQKCIKH